MGTILLSLFLAVLVWTAAESERDPLQRGRFGPVTVDVVGLPDNLIPVNNISNPQVRLNLQAPQSSWNDITPQKFRVWIDLSQLPEGLHDVPVQVEIADRAVRVLNTEPAAITVQLEAVASTFLPVEVELTSDLPLGYQLESLPATEPLSVTIRGPASTVERVEQVVARVPVGNEKETIERLFDVFPLDANGDSVANLTLDPERVLVTVPIRQRFGYQEISIRPVTTGTVASGYWISDISTEPNTVTAVGGPRVLRDLAGFVETVPVDVSGATESISVRVSLNLPPGISVVLPREQEQTSSAGVLVTIKVSALEGGQIVGREITVQGVDPRYDWTISPEQVDVIISGPLPKLQALEPDDLVVVLDLVGLEVGVHRLEPSVVVPEGLRVESVLPDHVEVNLSLRPTETPTVTPTPTGTSTATATADATISATARLTTTPVVTMTPVVPRTGTPTPTPGR
ncbi:MAG: YbbR-like domain-containing protein [Anaerolineae bacterium]